MVSAAFDDNGASFGSKNGKPKLNKDDSFNTREQDPIYDNSLDSIANL